MTLTFKRVFIAAAMLLSVQAASASTGLSHQIGTTAQVDDGTGHTTTIGPGHVVSNQGSLSLSADALGFLDTGKIDITPKNPVHAGQDTEGYYTYVDLSSSNAVARLDNATLQVVGFPLADNAITLTAPTLKSLSSGGSLTISDLTVGLDHKVYATLMGANGVGTLTDLAMFTYEDADFSVTKVGGVNPICGPYPSSCDDLLNAGGLQRFNFDLTDAHLHLTAQGITAITQSLGLLTLGKAALLGFPEFGTASLHATVYALPNAFDAMTVPEPGNMALTGLGLAGLIGLRRRRSN